MPRMKTLIPFALSILTLPSVAFGTPYQFSTRDTEIGNIILAKNCLDYNFCGGDGASLAGGDGSWRLHTRMDLNRVQLNRALITCDFKNIGTQVSILNRATKESVSLDPLFDASEYFDPAPNLNIAQMSQSEKAAKSSRIDALLKSGKKSEAVSAVISEYGFKTNGYSIRIMGDMGNAGAVTDHSKREIRISESAFQHPCVLIQTVRHELEHTTQMTRVDNCLSKTGGHNLMDHVNRERSAYLNDIRTIPQFCPDARVSKSMQDGVTQTFLDSYIIRK
jgi:hypothetical protein